MKYRALINPSALFHSFLLVAHRPVVANIKKLLDREKSWMIPKLFGGRSVSKVAHALAGRSHCIRHDYDVTFGFENNPRQIMRIYKTVTKNKTLTGATSKIYHA